MLKRKIDKAAYDALNDAIKAEYKPNGDSYVLDTDDARELISARDAEKQRAETIANELKTTKTKLAELETANGDFTSLKTSYETKIAALEKEKGELNTTLTTERRDRHVGEAAAKIAGRFSVPRLVRPDIEKRLDVDPKDGKTVRVLDKDGKPSALTLVDLEKEFVDNAEFKSILIGSKASGSADTGQHPRGSAPKTPVNSDGSPVDLSKLSPADLAAHMAAKKDTGDENNT